jgi:glycosyltransferase involved in cell wall biosynthesis
VAHGEVAPLMAAHDVFFLPTLGENYGYVVAEALAAGCPVLLSDRTSWRDLQSAGVGADLPLDDIEAFRQALSRWAALSETERTLERRRCLAYARQRLQGDASISQMRGLLMQVIRPKLHIASTSTPSSGGP